MQRRFEEQPVLGVHMDGRVDGDPRCLRVSIRGVGGEGHGTPLNSRGEILRTSDWSYGIFPLWTGYRANQVHGVQSSRCVVGKKADCYNTPVPDAPGLPSLSTHVAWDT